MRVAVVSDVHGNHLALEAVLADIAAQAVDTTLNLGDCLSGPLEPGLAADMLISGGFPTIAGNHDRYLVENSLDSLGRVDRFLREKLALGHFEWLQALPSTRVVGGTIFMCHGTPTSDETPWLDNWLDGRQVEVPDQGTVETQAEGFDYPVLLCGHTHVPRVVRLADGRLVVNPGSVGLQMNFGSPDAHYALIERHGGDWSVSLRTVPYDRNAAAAIAVRNGFPAWGEALITGWRGADGLF
jgi:predicted phosphodiesterase